MILCVAAFPKKINDFCIKAKSWLRQSNIVLQCILGPRDAVRTTYGFFAARGGVPPISAKGFWAG